MKRAWVLMALSLGCVTYEGNPDGGPEDGGEYDAGNWDGGGDWDGGPGGGGGGGGGFWDGGGFGWDGGNPNCVPSSDRKGPCIVITPGDGGPGGPGYPPNWPGSAASGDPGTALLFLIRIDRGTANLAEGYAQMVLEAQERLVQAGLGLHSVGVASLYSGELVWSAASGSSLAEVLRAKAAATDGHPPLTCTSDALASMATQLPTLTDPNGNAAFSTPFSAFMVIVIDSGARPYGPENSHCNVGSAGVISYFSSDPAHWLNSSAGRLLPRPQVRFVHVATPENVSTADMKRTCSTQDVEVSAIDSLEASPVAFIGPFHSGLNSTYSGASSSLDFCTEYSGRWRASIGGIAGSWVTTLRNQPPWE